MCIKSILFGSNPPTPQTPWFIVPPHRLPLHISHSAYPYTIVPVVMRFFLHQCNEIFFTAVCSFQCGNVTERNKKEGDVKFISLAVLTAVRILRVSWLLSDCELLSKEDSFCSVWRLSIFIWYKMFDSYHSFVCARFVSLNSHVFCLFVCLFVSVFTFVVVWTEVRWKAICGKKILGFYTV